MIAVVDYDAGNLRSVETALKYLKADFSVTSDPDELIKADKVIFPGVGEAGYAMTVLKKRGLDSALKEFAASGKPLFGICLGSQILLEHSQESDTDLLDLVPGNVRRFPEEINLKIPQMGWNTVKHDDSGLFHDIPQESSFYFVHSYYMPLTDEDGMRYSWAAASSTYGIDFACAVHKDNVWAVQFHPEKSGMTGLKLLGNFVERIN